MSTHRSETPRRRADRPAPRTAARPRRRSGRTRALLSLGAVVVLCTGLSVKGTFAFWTDSATATTGTFSSGTLDLTVDGKLGGQAANGASTAIASLVATNLVPGESIAAAFPVKNDGTIPLTYTLTGTGTGALAVTNGLQYSLTFGATAANATATNGLRSGTCGGVASSDTNTAVLNATATTYATNRPLAAAASDTVCVVVRLNSNAPNALQGQQGNASFLFDAKQIGA